MTVRFRLAHYEIADELGHGGMGVVYRARDTRLGRALAIKVLPLLMRSDPERRARFLREARAAAALNHPNIATVYEVGEAVLEPVGDAVNGGADNGGADNGGAARLMASSCPYIAMEFVPGEDLHDRLAHSDPLPVDTALAMAIQIADALDIAHKAGVIHRDLKPRNIRVTPEGRIKILDFGLAKVVQRDLGTGSILGAPGEVRTVEGMIVGTVPYMAPEQLEGRGVDARSDLFAFGVVLYQMLVGRVPFAGPGLVQYVRALSAGQLEPPSTHNPQVPVELDRIVVRLLARASGQRYSSASLVVEDLRSLADSGEVSSPGLWSPQSSRHAPVSLAPERSERETEAKIKSRGGARWRLSRHGGGIGVGLLLVLAVVWGARGELRDWFASPLSTDKVLAGSFRGSSEEETRWCGRVKTSVIHELKEHEPTLLIFGHGSQEAVDIRLEGECHQVADDAKVNIKLYVSREDVLLLDAEFWPDFPVGAEVYHEIAFSICEVLATLRAFDQPGVDEAAALRATQRFIIGVRELENATRPDVANFSARHFDQALDPFRDLPVVNGRLNELIARGWRDASKRDRERLEETARRAEAGDRDGLEGLLARARVERLKNNTSQAIERSERAVAIYPESPRAHFELAVSLKHGDQEDAKTLGLSLQELRDKAAEELRESTRLRPGFWRYWNERGAHALHFGSASLDEIEIFFRKAVALSRPRVASPRENLANLLMRKKAYQEAIEVLRSVPDQERTASFEDNLGAAHYFQGHNQQAARHFRRAIAKWPENAKFHLDLGDTLVRLGSSQEALQEYGEALARTEMELQNLDENWHAGDLRGPRKLLRAADRVATLGKLGRCDEAVSDAGAVIRGFDITSPDPRVPFALARAFAVCQRMAEARKWLRISTSKGVTEDWVRASVEFDQAASLVKELGSSG